MYSSDCANQKLRVLIVREGKTKGNIVLRILIVLIGALLLNCSANTNDPLSAEQIINICLSEKQKAARPETEINLSKSKKGNRIGFSVSFSSHFLKGTDPELVYKTCIKKLSYK